MAKRTRMHESELYGSFCDEDWDHMFISPPPESVNIHVNPQYAQADPLLCPEGAAEWPSWDCGPTRVPHPAPAYDEALEELLLLRALPDLYADQDQFVASEPTESNSASTGSSFGAAPVGDPSALTEEEYKGLRIVHLLLACAEATSAGDSRDLAEVTRRRLRELVSPTGTAMERVGYYLFEYALQGRRRAEEEEEEEEELCDLAGASQEVAVGALALLHQAFPYARVAHFTANQSILEAIPRRPSTVHIIDFDVMEGVQWPPLMEALAREDFEVREIRMSAVKWSGGQSWARMCGDAGRRLREYAGSLGIAFSFEEAELRGLKDVAPEEGALVVANCMWQLPHMSQLRTASQVSEFLAAVRRLRPAVLTFAAGAAVVGAGGGGDFLRRFCRCLESLCAVFDSLEAGLPHHGLARATVERFFFGPKMCRLMMLAGDEEEEEEGCDCVRNPPEKALALPLRCGFVEGVISHDNMLRANALLSSLGRAESCYEVQYGGDHQLVLKWGSAPLLWVSSWNSSS